MTNLLNLPQLPLGTAITLASNDDFLDQLYMPAPGYPGGSIGITGNLSSSSTTVSSPSTTNGIVPGMQVVGVGILANTTVLSLSPLVLSNEPTETLSGVELTFFAPPLDLTGISFKSVLRSSVISTQALLTMSTANGMMTNGLTGGQFGWNVPADELPEWPNALYSAGTLSLVLDIEAADATGATVNLCKECGPIPVTVNLAVTR
jgi:hypothetical protein